MQPAVDLAVIILRRAAGRDRYEPGDDAADRPAGTRHPLLRCPADDLAPTKRRSPGDGEAHPSADAAHAPIADLPEALRRQAAGPARLENAGGGPPEIMNSDQVSPFRCLAWTDRLNRIGTRISTNDKGRCLDSILIERLWRSLKHECLQLHAWETGSQAKASIGPWITRLQLPTSPRRPWRKAARRGPLQPDRNRPVEAESTLNNPGNYLKSEA